jgi:hypothetical protein
LKRKIEEIVNQLFVLMLRLSVLILEFFVEWKPELLQNFSSYGGWVRLKSIGTIFIARMLRWSNGYCISSPSSDDGNCSWSVHTWLSIETIQLVATSMLVAVNRLFFINNSWFIATNLDGC